MINTQELLRILLETVQLDQHLLSVAVLSASSHGLKSILGKHLLEYDRLEIELQEHAGRRGWELSDLQPALRWNQGVKFRLSVRNRDERIAERLIYLHTSERINLLRLGKEWDQSDVQAKVMLQKLLDSKAIHIRQMELHL